MIHQLYALIFDGEVVNIFVCEDYELANQLARATYGNSAVAVECNQYPCTIGDRYINNTFYRTDNNGEEVEIQYVPTEKQMIELLNIEVDTMSEYMVELDYQAAMLSLGL